MCGGRRLVVVPAADARRYECSRNVSGRGHQRHQNEQTPAGKHDLAVCDIGRVTRRCGSPHRALANRFAVPGRGRFGARVKHAPQCHCTATVSRATSAYLSVDASSEALWRDRSPHLNRRVMARSRGGSSECRRGNPDASGFADAERTLEHDVRNLPAALDSLDEHASGFATELLLRQVDGRQRRREAIEPRMVVAGHDRDVVRTPKPIIPERLHGTRRPRTTRSDRS
jgi:hypothetical protein